MFLNNTSAETYENCMRRGYWSREFSGLDGPGGITTQYSDDNLVTGQLIHAAFANLYGGALPGEAVDRAVGDIKETLDFDSRDYEFQNKWQETFEWTGRVVDEYEKWRVDVDDFQVLQVESEGCVVLGEICYACGAEYPDVERPEERPEDLTSCPRCGEEVNHWVFRTDLVVANGYYVEIIDHKTTKSVSDLYLRSWDNSFQLWGYCYGYEKATDLAISSYRMNIIRKLKSIGQPEQTTKQCPTCRNGKHKKIGCPTCESTGRVARENNPSEQPFQRTPPYDWNDERRERFVRQRLNTISRIQDERARMAVEPAAAFPMNPKACHTYGACPFIPLCYRGDPEKWYAPSDILLDRYEARGEDYVSVRELAKEEAK